ncbi:HNH endonuclease [Paraburkholderia ribeironis]|nr:HNH endonuclease [Paraburkholderia ribeironis]
MAKSITQFFERYRLPFKNKRWSWGALRDDVVLLRTWEHEYSGKQKRVVVLQRPEAYLGRDSYGLDERIRHLRQLWEGSSSGYTVIARAEDVNAHPRKIADFRDDAVFVIDRLESEEGGEIVAVLSGLATGDLFKHAQNHKTKAEGKFPDATAQETGLSTGNLAMKLPMIREWLIEVAKRKSTVTYGELMDTFGLHFFLLYTAMRQLGHQCVDAKEPVITALIVDKDSGKCSEGLEAEFGITDDERERARCYELWSDSDETAPTDEAQLIDESKARFDSMLARFSLTQVRPFQAAFREAVFRRFSGRCAISGCDVPEALEAAHINGRDWRHGHNSAEDGLLLRRDLHALYDNGVIQIASDGTVSIGQQAPYYAEFLGVKIVPWLRSM